MQNKDARAWLPTIDLLSWMEQCIRDAQRILSWLNPETTFHAGDVEDREFAESIARSGPRIGRMSECASALMAFLVSRDARKTLSLKIRIDDRQISIRGATAHSAFEQFADEVFLTVLSICCDEDVDINLEAARSAYVYECLREDRNQVRFKLKRVSWEKCSEDSLLDQMHEEALLARDSLLRARMEASKRVKLLCENLADIVEPRPDLKKRLEQTIERNHPAAEPSVEVSGAPTDSNIELAKPSSQGDWSVVLAKKHLRDHFFKLPKRTMTSRFSKWKAEGRLKASRGGKSASIHRSVFEEEEVIFPLSVAPDLKMAQD